MSFRELNSLDLLVGAISAILGTVLLYASVVGDQRARQITRLQRMLMRLGDSTARIVSALIGLAFIALGIAVAFGWRLF